MSEKWRKAWCVIFFLGYFFSDNTRLFGIIWASLWEKLFSGKGGGFDKECFKPVSSAKETSLKIEISPAASLHMILSKKQKKRRWSDCADAQAGLCLCCSQTPEDRVSRVEAHMRIFLVKWFVTLSEIACRLPGFQRGKDRITIIGKSVGVSSPGNITSMIQLVCCTYSFCPLILPCIIASDDKWQWQGMFTPLTQTLALASDVWAIVPTSTLTD